MGCLRAEQGLERLIEAARPFLRGEVQRVDPKLPSLISVLQSVGAGECWHKHGSFLDHLIDMYKIPKLWNCPDSVCLCGLFHSAYSNSYVNLAIFDPSTSRQTLRSLVGDAAERLIHLFCVVPRQTLIHDDLLFHYSDQQLIKHLQDSETSLSLLKAKPTATHPDEEWRKKIQSLVPADGIVVKHIKTGEDVALSRRLVAVFLMMTMADFSDQLFSFQDLLFENENGRLEFSGDNYAAALWPGDGKPGLWMNSISRMGALYSLIVREEEIYMQEKEQMKKKKNDNGGRSEERDEEIELVIPPVFHYCTKVLDAEEQRVARDLYWEALCGDAVGPVGKTKTKTNTAAVERSEELLVRSVEKNPFVGEPHVVLAQIYLTTGRFEEAQREGEKGLRLLLEWGSPWDKRMSWEGWVAWARVLLMKAKDKSWPHSSWGILNLGLVK